MSFRIGAVVGLAVFAGILIIGILQSMALEDILERGLAGFWVGFLIGWLVFGPLGLAVADRGEERPAPAPEEKGGPLPAQAEKKESAGKA